MKPVFRKFSCRRTARRHSTESNAPLRLVYNRRGQPTDDPATGWVEKEISIAPCAVNDPKPQRRTPYSRWLRATFVVPDTNFGNLPLFFKCDSDTTVYIRAVSIRSTVFPDQQIRWGQFSGEKSPTPNTCRLITGEEPVEKAGVPTCRLGGERSTAYIQASAAADTIPEYTSSLTAVAEYRLEPPRRKKEPRGKANAAERRGYHERNNL